METPAGIVLTGFVAHSPGEHPVEKKADERAFVLQMLREELNDNSLSIVHTATGQPFIPGHSELFISVSHSNGWCALVLSRKAVGIDIQTFTSRLDRGMDYFVNKTEKAAFGDPPVLQQLYLTWCAKEAIYKQQEGRINDLKNDVTVFNLPSLSETTSPVSGIFSAAVNGTVCELLFWLDEEKALVVTA